MILRIVFLFSLILVGAILGLIFIVSNPISSRSTADVDVIEATVGVTASRIDVTETADNVAVEPQLPEITPTPKKSWLRLPPLPASATSADIGAEIYRLVCRDCHGDKGQGLTDEWRATWDPEDQNCWQSKCHAANHPVNGFDLPRYVPAIIGPSTLARFREPAELQEYILVSMPWHDPGSLTNQEYWQLTAFLIRENGGEPIELP